MKLSFKIPKRACCSLLINYSLTSFFLSCFALLSRLQVKNTVAIAVTWPTLPSCTMTVTWSPLVGRTPASCSGWLPRQNYTPASLTSTGILSDPRHIFFTSSLSSGYHGAAAPLCLLEFKKVKKRKKCTTVTWETQRCDTKWVSLE